eukprot:gene16815-23016_t
MAFDLYLSTAKCFATWLRVQILMAFVMMWCIILMGVSAAQTISDGGDIQSVKFNNGTTSYNNWDGKICNAIPYVYLRPFHFEFTMNGNTSKNPSLCAWPDNNSSLRLTITVTGFCFLLLMYFKTPFSLLARTLMVIYALLFFASFVLDTNAIIIGDQNCSSMFKNTNMHSDFTAAGITLNCSTNDNAVVIVIDLILSFLFFFLHSAWGLTTDLYLDKSGKNDRASLL